MWNPYLTYTSFHQVLCADIDHSATNCLCRVKAKCMILISLPRIKDFFGVDSSFIYCPPHSNINQFTVKEVAKYETLTREQ